MRSYVVDGWLFYYRWRSENYLRDNFELLLEQPHGWPQKQAILDLRQIGNFIIIAESFYYVKYGSSIITSKILSNENKELVFPEK